MITNGLKNLSNITGIDAQTIQRGFEQAQKSLTVNADLSQIVKELRALDKDLKLIVMSNISQVSVNMFTGILSGTKRSIGTFSTCTGSRPSLETIRLRLRILCRWHEETRYMFLSACHR